MRGNLVAQRLDVDVDLLAVDVSLNFLTGRRQYMFIVPSNHSWEWGRIDSLLLPQAPHV